MLLNGKIDALYADFIRLIIDLVISAARRRENYVPRGNNHQISLFFESEFFKPVVGCNKNIDFAHRQFEKNRPEKEVGNRRIFRLVLCGTQMSLEEAKSTALIPLVFAPVTPARS